MRLRRPYTEGDIIASVDRLTAVLEATARGLRHTRHAKHLKPAKASVKAIFARLFAEQKEQLLHELGAHVRTAFLKTPGPDKLSEASASGRNFAANVLPTNLKPLKLALTSDDVNEYNKAITNVINGAVAVAVRQLDTPGAQLPTDFASKYLRENSLLKLTGGIEDTTLDRLRSAIAQAWDDGGSYSQIVNAVRDTMETFSETRAGMIAQTETVDAYNAGRGAIARAAGVDEKQWETESGNPCPVCIGNEGDGWIPIDESFSSGDDAPTAHVNCECVLNFRKSTSLEA